MPIYQCSGRLWDIHEELSREILPDRRGGEKMLDATHKTMLENLFEAAYVVDRERRIVFWNRAAEQLTGFSSEEVIGRECSDGLLHHVDGRGKMRCDTECPLHQTLGDGAEREEMLFFHHKEGHRVLVTIRVSPIMNEGGDVLGAVEMFQNVGKELEQEAKIAALEELAYIDSLTGLPNRRYLLSKIRGRLEELRRYDWPFGVLFMDVDNFKAINDTYGHDVGDAVLRMVASTLKSTMRTLDSIARYGGEEFVVVVSNVTMDQLARIGERFRVLVSFSSLREPVNLGVTVSIGAAMAETSDTPESLLKRADSKLYQAKHAGRNSIYT
jgi:diguanylate cyclase (GGDEF)-like protein/PAS domain S-box-containing protein